MDVRLLFPSQGCTEPFSLLQWVVLIVLVVESCMLNGQGACKGMRDLFLVMLGALSDFIECMAPPSSTWTCCNQEKLED